MGLIGTEVPTRERMQALFDAYTKIIKSMEDGNRVLDAPWNEPRFQELVTRALIRSGQNARAAAEFDTFKGHLRDVVGPK